MWHIRYESDICWVTPLLDKVVERVILAPHISLNIDLYVTRSNTGEEVLGVPDVQTDRVIPAFDAQTSDERQPLLVTANIPHLSPVVSSFLRWHRGRANLGLILRNDMEMSHGNCLAVSGERVNQACCILT